MRHSSFRAGAPLLLVLGLGLAGAACGASPSAKLNTAGVPPQAPVSNAAGQQVAVAGPAADSELSGSAKDAYDRGFQAWLAGDLAAAKAAFSEASSAAPSAGGPKYSLGCVEERLGNAPGALDAYRSAFSSNPKYEVAAGAYALLLARTGRGSDAEQFLSSKGAQNGESVRMMAYLAEVKSIQGDSPGCQQLAQLALAKQPDFKDAMLVIARDYYRGHRWDLAKYALQAILEGADDGSIPPRDKGNPEALLLRGLIERELGDRKSALADFDHASQKRPDLFEAFVNLGEMKLEAGNAGEAQPPLERAVKYAPNVPVAHLDLGDCYRLLGRTGDAKSELERARSMDSTLAGVHYDLGLLYLFSPNVPGATGASDQLAKAIEELEKFRSMRNAKVKGPGDDVEDLLSTAKRKQTELQMKTQAAAAASAAPAGSGAAPAAPPASGGPIVRDPPK